MAAIVYLDVDDEITSAAARLRTLTEERIALVLPFGSRLATSRINFRLLAKEAANRKKTLEIVTGDASTRALAASAGLTTHPSVAAFEGRVEPGPPAGAAHGHAGAGATAAGVTATAATTGATGAAGPGAGKPGQAGPPPGPGPGSADDSPTAVVPIVTALPALKPPRAGQPVPQVGRRQQAARPDTRMIAIALGLVAVLIAAGVAGYTLLPNATVTLTPASEKIGPIQLNVTAQTGITQPDPTRLLLPARTFTFDLDVSDTFPATGVKIDETTADGAVTFENCDTGGDVTIPARSVVSTTNDVRFVTLARVSVKRAHLFPFACELNDVAVVAALPGPTGNVAAGTITRIPSGYDPVVLRVTNQAPTTGGSHTETKQVTQADLDAAVGALTDKLTTTFDDKIVAREGVPEGTTLFDETRVLAKPVPSVDPKTLLDKLADTFDLGYTAKGTVVGVDPSPVNTLADARIRSSVKDGYTLIEDSIEIVQGDPLVTGSTITFPVSVSAWASRDLDVSALRARIRGLGLPQARTVLREYGDATIVVWPDWVTTIPSNDDRLSITITAPTGPSASPKPSVKASGKPSAAPSPAPTGSTAP